MAHAFVLGAAPTPDESDGITLTLLEKEAGPDDGAPQYRLNRVQHHDGPVEAEALAKRLQDLMAERPYTGRTTVIVDRGPDLGAALVEALRDRGLDPVAVTLASGDAPAERSGTDDVYVEVLEAVRTLVALYRDERFVVEEYATEEASRLARGTQRAFEALDEIEGDQASGGSATRSFRADEVDTYVTSAALAAWLGTERSFDPSQHLKQSPQTAPHGPNE